MNPCEMMPDHIEQIDQLLENIPGNTKIEHMTIKRLTAPGENYGSLMLSLEIFVRNYGTGMKKKLQMVAKKIPPTELFQKIFNIQVVFKKEVGFYKTIVPTLKSFCEEMGVLNILNCFAEFHGARFNLQCDENLVDEHAILVLENLNATGFTNIDRFTGFDIDCTKLILKDLAELHATALALKLKKPETFKELKKYCVDYTFPQEIMKNYRDVTIMVLRENANCADLLERISLLGEQTRPPAREPWATLIHCDLWTNNTMQKYREGKAIANKFVDFQMYSYGSAASDVFFFLWSSVSRSVLERCFDDLVQFYYDYFSRIFEAFHCGNDLPTFDCFMEDMRLEAVAFEFGHAIVFSTLIVNGKRRSTEMVGIPDQKDLYNNVPLEAKKRAWFMLEECAKRGWI